MTHKPEDEEETCLGSGNKGENSRKKRKVGEVFSNFKLLINPQEQSVSHPGPISEGQRDCVLGAT